MRVAIIHPWFPQYREALFGQIKVQAEAVGIKVDIYHGDVPPEWAARGDQSSSALSTSLPTRFFKLRRKVLVRKSLAPMRGRNYDLIVLEQAVRNLESYILLARRARSIAFWGHGRTYTETSSRLQEALKMWITRRGKWFFSYTEGGAQAVRQAGFPTNRVSVVRNSTDTEALRHDLIAAREEPQVARPQKPSVLYIGGLDAPKRIEFLLEALALAHAQNESLQVVVAGDGDQRNLVEDFCSEHTWAQYIGRVSGLAKARAYTVASAIVVPGRVGLVAVDAITCGIPIVTTDSAYHAPEFEYLTPGQNAVVTANTAKDFAAGINATVRDSEFLSRVRQFNSSSAGRFSIEHAASNFVTGLQSYQSLKFGAHS